MNPDDYVKYKQGLPNKFSGVSAIMEQPGEMKPEDKAIGSGGGVNNNMQIPSPSSNQSIVRKLNLFEEATQSLYGAFMEQSMGRLMGEMPTDSDKKIMYRLLDYIPEKSNAMGHAVMANVARSLRGDPAASQIAAKILDDKQTFDTKNNALQFGILKLTDPKVSASTKGSVMAGLRNYWDDYYGPDKSLKMTQSVGYLSQVGGIFEALLNKAAIQDAGSQSSGGGGGYVQQPDDEIKKLSLLENDLQSRILGYVQVRKTAGIDMENIEKDPTYVSWTENLDRYKTARNKLEAEKYGFKNAGNAAKMNTQLGTE